MGKLLIVMLLLCAMYSLTAKAQQFDATEFARHAGISAGITALIYVGMRYGLGIADKYGCFGWSFMATMAGGAYFEAVTNDTTSAGRDMGYNAIGGLSMAVPILLFEL